MATRNDDFSILKSNDDLMIGGYASIEIVDKQNDLITTKNPTSSTSDFHNFPFLSLYESTTSPT